MHENIIMIYRVMEINKQEKAEETESGCLWVGVRRDLVLTI